ncbi:sensor histidine kinase [Pediococcus acidilactici]
MHSFRESLKKIKWETYIWLMYLPFSAAFYLPARSWTDYFWLLMMVAFLVVYILVTEVPKWRKVTIPLELLITGSFAVWPLNFFMIIFTAWQVAFILSTMPRRYFGWFLMAYYALLGAGIIHSLQINPTSGVEYAMNAFGLIFPILSPIMSYGFARSVQIRKQMSQNNRRLENLIRRGERDRIARDLHDTLGQSFSMITVKTELAQKLLKKAPERVPDELRDIAQTSRANLQLVRQIVADLHQQTLSEVLLEQGKNLAEARIFMFTENEEAASKWPTEVQNCFAAVIVEAVTNVIRHSRASQVWIEFTQAADNYQLKVQDNGSAKQLIRENANGISGMQQRMREQNGEFEISSNLTGTLVCARLLKE